MAQPSTEHELWGWQRFFEEIERFVGESERQFANCNEGYAQYAIETFEFYIASVCRVRDHLALHHVQTASQESREVLSVYRNELEGLLFCLQELCRKWLEYHEMQEQLSASTAYRVSHESATSQRGRPRFMVSRDQLEYLRSLSFTWTGIASLLGVSRMTIFRRRVEFQMLNEVARFVENRELRTIVSSLRHDLPNVGEKMVLGRLRSMGYQVTRERVRQAIRATDPINSALRWQGVLTPRHPYSVPGPNSLWHIGDYVTVPLSCVCTLGQEFVHVWFGLGSYIPWLSASS